VRQKNPEDHLVFGIFLFVVRHDEQRRPFLCFQNSSKHVKESRIMKRVMLTTALIGMIGTTPLFAGNAITSQYTSLEEKDCQTLQTDEDTGGELWFVEECPGVGGYRVRVQYDDARASIILVTSKGKQQPLDFERTITHALSHLGKKLEWRLEKGITPVAMIVRVYYREEPEAPQISVLAVIKVSSQQSCIVAKIPAGSHANQKARAIADTAADRPCL